jgi:lipopolysaccharide transport system permease protein
LWAASIGESAAPMSDLPLTVYTPESPLRHPLKLLWSMLKDLMAARQLARRLFVRDISAQYRNSILGYAWVFIPPLAAALPFVFLNSQGVVAVSETPIPYAAFAIVGTTIWQAFADAVTTPLKAVTSARPMLARINFPREAVLLAALAQVVLNLLIRLALLIAVFLWFQIVPPATAVLFPVGLFGLVLAGFVLGVLITPLGLLYNDVQLTLPIALTFLMFLTPVLYPMPSEGAASVLLTINPLTPLVTTTRDWLTVGAAPQAGVFWITLAIAAVLLVMGWIVYRVALPHLIARMAN